MGLVDIQARTGFCHIYIYIQIFVSILHFIDHVPIPNSGGRGPIKNINGTCITYWKQLFVYIYKYKAISY